MCFQKCVVQVNFCHNFKEREVRDVRVDYYIDLWFWFRSRDLIGGQAFLKNVFLADLKIFFLV